MNAELSALYPNPAQVGFDMDKRLMNKHFQSFLVSHGFLSWFFSGCRLLAPGAMSHQPTQHRLAESCFAVVMPAPLGLFGLEVATSFPTMQALNPTLGSTSKGPRYMPYSTRL